MSSPTTRLDRIASHLHPSHSHPPPSVAHPHVCAAAAPAVPASLEHGARLRDKVVVITGAGSGIGRECAILFAKHGARIMASDVDERGLNETQRLVLQATPQAKINTLLGDVSSEQFNDKLVKQTVQSFGDLHVFFANAGVVGCMGNYQHITSESFKRTLDVNVVGVFLGFQRAIDHFRSRSGGGVLLATSSVASLRSGAGGVDYAASKAAVSSMVCSFANELFATGIRVNSVCPGLFHTGMTGPLFDGAKRAGTTHKIGQLNPLNRPGSLHEIAAAALFLVSDESSYIHGQNILVDGGLSSSLPVAPRKA